MNSQKSILLPPVRINHGHPVATGNDIHSLASRFPCSCKPSVTDNLHGAPAGEERLLPLLCRPLCQRGFQTALLGPLWKQLHRLPPATLTSQHSDTAKDGPGRGLMLSFSMAPHICSHLLCTDPHTLPPLQEFSPGILPTHQFSTRMRHGSPAGILAPSPCHIL